MVGMTRQQAAIYLFDEQNISKDIFAKWLISLIFGDNFHKIVLRPQMQAKGRESQKVPGWIILDV